MQNIPAYINLRVLLIPPCLFKSPDPYDACTKKGYEKGFPE